METDWKIISYDGISKYRIRHLSCGGSTPTWLSKAFKERNKNKCVLCKAPIPDYLIIQRDLLNG